MCVNCVEVLYTCVVCGKAFTKRQSLAAHMRVHRDVEFKRFSVRLPRELVDRFDEVVRRHKTTRCAVIHGIVQAVVQGEKLGLVKLNSANPMYVVVQDFYAARPKARGKYVPPPRFEPGRLFEVPRCGLIQSVSLESGEVYCGGAGTWVSPEKCRKCSFNQGFIKLG